MKKASKLFRIAALLMALLMLLPLAMACKKEEETTETETTEEVVETTDPYEYDENGFVKDTIPDSVNYGNKKVSLLCWIDNSSLTTLPTEASEDTITAELYMSRLELEERLGLIFEVHNEPGYLDPEGTIYNTFLTTVENNVKSGDVYDTVCAYSSMGPSMATRGLLKNMKTLEYPQLNMPWWPDAVSDWEQYGGQYYVASNSSIQALRAMFIMYCNSQMFIEKGLEDPVDLVLKDEWTMSKMLEYVVNFDISTDEVYGLVVDDSTRMDAFYYGCGFRNTQKNADGKTELAFVSETTKERISNLIDTMVPVFNSGSVTIANNTAKAMVDKDTALMVATLTWMTKLEDYDYCAIPMPMLDGNQEGYISTQSAGYDIWAIPITAEDPEMSGIIIEAKASSDYRNVAPLYFETYMKLRYSRDEITSSMFDIIRGSITHDFGRINQVELNYRCEVAFRTCFVQKNSDGVWAPYAQNSYVTKVSGENKSLMETELATILNKYREYS